MKTREEIIEILEREFGCIYCYNCAHDTNVSACEECHRKYMKWEISHETAEKIADRILN